MVISLVARLRRQPYAILYSEDVGALALLSLANNVVKLSAACDRATWLGRQDNQRYALGTVSQNGPEMYLSMNHQA